MIALHWKSLSLIFIFECYQAIDPDTVEKSVTYVIKDGPYDKFYIDAVDGTVFSAGPLDYEEKNQHILIVGTEENTSGNLGSTATVIIHLIDRNDVKRLAKAQIELKYAEIILHYF